jgi:enoyl-CoA hydratase/carnithine racemase
MNPGKITVSTITTTLRPLSWGPQCQGFNFDSFDTMSRASRFACTGAVKDQSVSEKKIFGIGIAIANGIWTPITIFRSSARFSLNRDREENIMNPHKANYFDAYRSLKLTRDAKGVLVAEFHTNGGPFIMTAQSHTEFVDAFYRIAQDRANKIVILTGAGGEFITDVDWSSFGDVTDPGVWSQVHDEGVQVLENIANIRVPVIAAIEGRAHVHSDYALLASVIVAADGATFQDVAHFSAGVAPGDGIFTTWSYRAGAGRAEAFLLNPQPLPARTAYEWGVVAEVVPSGKAVSRVRELAELYLKAPEVTRRNTRIHFIQPLKERIVREVGYGLSLEGASSAALIKSKQAKAQPSAEKGKVA